MAQDSSQAQFWEVRYRGGVTPWDAGSAPASLGEWLARRPGPQRVLIPGCGSGYEVRAFAEAGHDVLAVDFADAALEAARRELGPLAGRVRKADFFAFDAGLFDVVYERAFLCALPRAQWSRWAARVGALLKPGGLLAGFFYFDDNRRGPPFGISPAALDELLSPGFLLVEDREVPPEQSIDVFKGKERWQTWARRL